jgi:ABC-2 type transport system permease protein
VKRFFLIIIWEFGRHLQSRKFFLATFVSPLVFTAIVLIPSFYYEQSQMNQEQIIGCVELDSSAYSQLLSERLANIFDTNRPYPRILLEPILPDTTAKMREDFNKLRNARQNLDSLNEAYNKIKERRKYHFQRPDSPTKQRLLQESYEEMISTRELRDLGEIEYTRLQTKTDSIVQKTVLNKADSLLKTKRIAGYILIDSQTFKEGIVEFHSGQPINFLRVQPLEHALQVLLVEERMRDEGITVSKIQELLHSIEIQELLVEGSSKHEFKFMVTYLAPIIAVLLLFIAIFTSSGFLFSTITFEKSHHISELLISSVHSAQIIAGKIIGFGFLGILQVLIWMFLLTILILTKIIPMENVVFLTLDNAGLFLWYFTLGYLLSASMFVGLGALSAIDRSSHQFTQFVRILSVFPIALVILVLISPNSMLVRFLSFIPFLTPTFMILRTPLGQPPAIDYYISSGIMIATILFFLFISGKIFRNANLTRYPKRSLKSILEFLHAK